MAEQILYDDFIKKKVVISKDEGIAIELDVIDRYSGWSADTE